MSWGVTIIGVGHDSPVASGDVRHHRGWLVLAVVLGIVGAAQLVAVITAVIQSDYFAALAALAGVVICYWFGGDAWRRAHRRIAPSQSPGD
jgi:hypothetical protein